MIPRSRISSGTWASDLRCLDCDSAADPGRVARLERAPVRDGWHYLTEACPRCGSVTTWILEVGRRVLPEPPRRDDDVPARRRISWGALRPAVMVPAAALTTAALVLAVVVVVSMLTCETSGALEVDGVHRNDEER